MEEAKRVLLNIVTWNHHVYLPRLLASIDAQTFPEVSVSIIDNASDDGAAAWLQIERPDVAVLRNFRNQGSARAHNQGIALACSRWTPDALLNSYLWIAQPDMEFDPACLSELVARLDGDQSLAACVPKIKQARVQLKSDDERDVVRTNVFDSFGTYLTRSRRVIKRGRGEEDQGQYDAIPQVFGFSRCVLIRAAVLQEIKCGEEWFDEDFGEGYEDIDLAWRMRRLGFTIGCAPRAIVWRHEAPRHRIHLVRNHVWLVWKNDQWINRLLHAPWILTDYLVKFVRALLRPALMIQTCSAFLRLPLFWSKRRDLARRARVSARDMRRWFV